ncbi:hypothetical protein V5O48_002293 [Marasmius crinis-equi]|uniref:FAD-binding domain-containing protein n=1 Tax=Marasmius crinis-equi TaxID=585013 RepID=A0ABR3FW94_9AGAR
MTTQPPKQLRIAIVGAGIGGLSCAVALKDCTDVQLDLYEQAPQMTEIGAGVTVWPRTWGMLKAMGMEEELVKRLKEPPKLDEPMIAFAFRKSDQEEGYPLVDLKIDGGSLNFHRKDIHQALLQQLPSFGKIHLNHRLEYCKETDRGVELKFLNGNMAECDLLIGADGVKSVVRRCVKGEGHASPVYTGTVAFRGLVPREKLAKVHPGHRTLDRPLQYCGKDRHIVVYPISQNQIVNVVAFYSKMEDLGKPLRTPEVREARLDEVLEIYKGWEPEVQELLGCIENPTCWVIQDLDPLESYITDRTLLLGDASVNLLINKVWQAHAMTPHLGAGAGQAMEDAYILGAIISASSRTKDDIPRILETYDAVRKPFANYIMSTAREQGTCYEMNAPEFQSVKEQGMVLSEEQISVFANTVKQNWSWATSSVDRDRQRAVTMMASSGKL